MELKKTRSGRPLAVVTGASSGIGYELAKVFAKNGFDLLVVAEDDGIVEAGNAFRVLGAHVESVQIDLAKNDGADAVYRAIHGMGKPIEALALNAGVGVGGEFLNTNWEEELNLINLNIISVVRLTKLVLKDMLIQGHGKILFTSSVAAEMPGPYYAVYAASKAFVQSFSEAIRSEIKEKEVDITITALQPGATETKFFERAHMLDTKAGHAKKDSAAEVAEEGFKALMDGKDSIVAGSFMNKVQAGMARLMTEPMQAKAQGRSTKPDDLKIHH